MTDDVWQRDEVQSPCVKVCVVHPETGLCLGCKRSVDEIARWSRMTADERRVVIAALPARKAGPEGRRGGASARRGDQRRG